jgi:hypothetical protein
MTMRRRWALPLVGAALSRVDEKVVPRLARGLNRVRARVLGGRRPGLTALSAVLVVAAAAAVVVVLTRPEPPRSPGTSPTWVGVHDGDSVPAYLELSAARLSALAAADPGRVVYALVSFTRYLTPDEVASVLAATPEVISVTAHGRVPLPRRQTQLVSLPAIRLPQDLVASMAEIADLKAADAEHYAALAAEHSDDATLRAIYLTNEELARAEAAAYREACACVFGLVVRGGAAALADLAAAADVRAVDPAPDVTDPGAAVFAPPLPEQVDRVTPPADDALPTEPVST